MRWRWDQGRLDYFQFDAIRRTAVALAQLDGVKFGSPGDPLRATLEREVELPFAVPENYRVWRNYKRVFGVSLLAAEISGQLVCTETCRQLAKSDDAMSAEEYFLQFARRFYFPTPAFDGYTPRGQQVFPICALVKLLIARAQAGLEASVSVAEVLEFIIANECTGEESSSFYAQLLPRPYAPAKDEERQTREFIQVASQLSFLKWQKPKIFLDLADLAPEKLDALEALMQPEKSPRKADRSQELLQLGRRRAGRPVEIFPVTLRDDEVSFTEGKPKRSLHLRYERSPKLRSMFFQNRSRPFLCEMCVLDVRAQYPWTENILEVHHLLPLSSPVRVATNSTSLTELVGICPNCHKATHVFYRDWLDEQRQDDFNSFTEARAVYNLAKQQVVAARC